MSTNTSFRQAFGSPLVQQAFMKNFDHRALLLLRLWKHLRKFCRNCQEFWSKTHKCQLFENDVLSNASLNLYQTWNRKHTTGRVSWFTSTLQHASSKLTGWRRNSAKGCLFEQWWISAKGSWSLMMLGIDTFLRIMISMTFCAKPYIPTCCKRPSWDK